MSDEQLMQKAMEARKFAYAPYSRFSVGAALLAKDGTVYLGCNIENASFGATCCAERTALFKAVSEGCKEFSAIAVYSGNADTVPCGICLQALAEFCDLSEFRVICTSDRQSYRVCTLGELFPHAFALDGKAED